MPRPRAKRGERKTKRRRYEAQKEDHNAFSPLSEGSASAGPNDDLTPGAERSGGEAPELLSEVTSIGTAGGLHTPPYNKVVMAPYLYMSTLPSKGVREKFITALNVWLKVPEDRLAIISQIIAMLHHMSLMLDDIEDESPLRRGYPSTHMIYGHAQTINSANYMFVEAFSELEKLSSAACRQIFLAEVESLHCGQAHDLHWKYHVHCPSEDEYMTMVDSKTGGLFRLAVRLMQEQSESRGVHFHDFVTLLGRFFQIRDDYQNLMSDEYANQKGWCEDLDEGKISLPLIYTLSAPGAKKHEIVSLMRKKTGGTMPKEMKYFILREMKEAGALDRTKTLLKSMQQSLLAELGKLEVAFGSKNHLIGLVLEKLWV